MKTWADKATAFESVYQRGRVARVWDYIPNRKMAAIDDATTDTDGYWIYLNDGWTAYDGGEDCGIIHEYNVKDLKDAIKTIREADK